MNTAEKLRKYLLPNLPYLIFLIAFAKLGEAIRLAPGADASEKLLGFSTGFNIAFSHVLPGAGLDYVIGLAGMALMRLVVYVKSKNAKKFRRDAEYGSARWSA